MHGTPTMEKFVPNTRCVTCCPFPSSIHRAENTTVAYSGEDASLSAFIRLLLDQLPPSVSNPRRLRTNNMSQLLLFLNGHGGDHFFKFQVNDHQTLIPQGREELNDHILSNLLSRMYQMRRYQRVLVMIDTCQAATLIPKRLPPHSSFLASSSLGEESYSYGFDSMVGTD